eukprot:SAG25_NODE_276_length_10527_cov_19.954737_3_plen_99_part_00
MPQFLSFCFQQGVQPRLKLEVRPELQAGGGRGTLEGAGGGVATYPPRQAVPERWPPGNAGGLAGMRPGGTGPAREVSRRLTRDRTPPPHRSGVARPAC